MPPITHLFYIPIVLLVGIVFGYSLAYQSAKERIAAQRRRAEQKKESTRPTASGVHPTEVQAP